MKISELVEELKRIEREQGDIETRVQTLSHMWKPEPKVKQGS